MLPNRMELGPIGVQSVKFRSCIAVPVSLKNPCITCPNGVTVGDDFVLNASINEADDAALTCGDLIYYATQIETESDYCRIFGEFDESYCCPPEVTPAPTPMPGDDSLTSTTISSTLAYEVDNPCIICPNGATAGYDDIVPYPNSTTPGTSSELIDAAKLQRVGPKIAGILNFPSFIAASVHLRIRASFALMVPLLVMNMSKKMKGIL